MLIISAELHNIRRDFDAYKKDPPLHSQFPLYAGKAMWARGLAQRIKQQFDLLESAKYITPVKEAEEARIDYNELKQALDGYVQRYYREWIASLQDANLYVIFMSFCSCFFSCKRSGKRLEVPILIRNEATRYLEVNFDRDLLRLFQEVYYWQRLKEDVPFAALDLASQSDEHRIVREHVLLLVHDYNEILAALDDNERKV